jgi:hypothetical protein
MIKVVTVDEKLISGQEAWKLGGDKARKLESKEA